MKFSRCEEDYIMLLLWSVTTVSFKSTFSGKKETYAVREAEVWFMILRYTNKILWTVRMVQKRTLVIVLFGFEKQDGSRGRGTWWRWMGIKINKWNISLEESRMLGQNQAGFQISAKPQLAVLVCCLTNEATRMCEQLSLSVSRFHSVIMSLGLVPELPRVIQWQRFTSAYWNELCSKADITHM